MERRCRSEPISAIRIKANGKWTTTENHATPGSSPTICRLSESGELFTFTTASRGGISAIGELCRRYSQHRKRHPDVLPMVTLDVDSYQHKLKEYGRIKVPRFTPMGWGPKSKFDAVLSAAGFAVTENEPAESSPTAAEELSDAIPF